MQQKISLIRREVMSLEGMKRARIYTGTLEKNAGRFHADALHHDTAR